MRKIADIHQASLQAIFRKLHRLKQIDHKVKPYLPEDLRPFCRVANFENGLLKFAVASSVWGAKLRYCLPALLTKLRKEADFPNLASISFYVEPAFEQLFRE